MLASVTADVVQQHVGEHRFEPAFAQLGGYDFGGAWAQLPSYLVLGLLAGLAAAGFIKVLYGTEDIVHRLLPNWVTRAVVIGLLLGTIGAVYPVWPPELSAEKAVMQKSRDASPLPPPLGVGYGVVDHALHLQRPDEKGAVVKDLADLLDAGARRARDLEKIADTLRGDAAPSKAVVIRRDQLLWELAWLLPLVFLKPVLTSLTLAGGGSGGVFAPSLFLGATLGASFGLLMNLLFPEYSHSPGVYAIVGMGAVVAGATQGVMSAILIVYEMTGNYQVILPVMAAAGLASLVARYFEPEGIYYKKLSRRGENISRGHDLHALDHVMVRDVMIRNFPTLKPQDDALAIIKVARENPEIESLPVMGDDGKLIGIIRAEDLHRVLDSDISPTLINAMDIALRAPLSVLPSENLIEAMRDFGARDIETLPVEVGKGESRRLVGLLLRADVIKRYRQEMLSLH